MKHVRCAKLRRERDGAGVKDSNALLPLGLETGGSASNRTMDESTTFETFVGFT